MDKNPHVHTIVRFGFVHWIGVITISMLVVACESSSSSVNAQCAHAVSHQDYGSAHDSCIAAATGAASDVTSMRLLGDLHYFGRGVTVDLDRAYYWYEQAAQNDDTEGMLAVGDMLHYGQSVERDLTAATTWYENAAQSGDFNATTRLAWMFKNGLGVERDTSHAKALILEAEPHLLALAEKGDARAQVSLARIYLYLRSPSREEVEKGVHFARLAAEQGHSEGQRHYGAEMIDGTAIQKDYLQGVDWLNKASEQGDHLAKAVIAVLMLLGEGMEQDPAKAFRLASSISDYRSIGGNLALGTCYETGICGVAIDLHIALEYYSDATELGDTISMIRIGMLYRDEGLGDRNDAKAFSWFQRAADLDDPSGQYLVGRSYLDGVGVAQNQELGLAYIEGAAEREDRDAQYFLGYAYYNGDFLKANDNKAVHWYQHAANQGHLAAQHMLGYMYQTGRGVDQSNAYAHAWYDVAAEYGNLAAADHRDRLAQTMNQSDIERAQQLKATYTEGHGLASSP